MGDLLHSGMEQVPFVSLQLLLVLLGCLDNLGIDTETRFTGTQILEQQTLAQEYSMRRLAIGTGIPWPCPGYTQLSLEARCLMPFSSLHMLSALRLSREYAQHGNRGAG